MNECIIINFYAGWIFGLLTCCGVVLFTKWYVRKEAKFDRKSKRKGNYIKKRI